MKNILIATTRQQCPSKAWCARGLQNLIEEAFPNEINWVVYDQNADLMHEKTPKTQRVGLHSNSFHHETLFPFSAAVLADGTQWLGHPLEALYGLLDKYPLPLIAGALQAPKSEKKLVELEKGVLRRKQTLLIAENTECEGWLKKQGLSATILPSPALFLSDHDTPNSRRNEKPVVGFIARQPNATHSEAFVRDYCSILTEVSEKHEILIACPTVDDFMRFSILFPDQAHYSPDPMVFLTLFDRCDLVVSPYPEFEAGIRSLRKPFYWVQDDLYGVKESIEKELKGSVRVTNPSTRQQWLNAITSHFSRLESESTVDERRTAHTA